MNNKIIILFILLMPPFFINGQDIIRWNINPIGNTIHKDRMYISQSVGQSSNVGVNINSDFKINQGFQQPLIFNNFQVSTSNQSFKIYPNPNKGTFTIEPNYSNRAGNYSVKITNQLGQLFDFVKVNNGIELFNYISILPGSYIVEIIYGDEIDSYNLIILP